MIPPGPFNVIYADPPWYYNEPGYRKHGKSKSEGEANLKYETMKLPELIAMKPMIDAWSAPDCALFMWATCPRLDMALDLGRAWGFRYVTRPWVWLKLNSKSRVAQPQFWIPLDARSPLAWFMAEVRTGMGFHSSIQTEDLLLFKRGAVPGFSTRLRPQLQPFPVREHSRKPDEFRGLIEAAYPQMTFRLEMFARSTAPGWESWGKEVGKFDG